MQRTLFLKLFVQRCNAFLTLRVAFAVKTALCKFLCFCKKFALQKKIFCASYGLFVLPIISHQNLNKITLSINIPRVNLQMNL